MKKILLLLLLFVFKFSFAQAQNPPVKPAAAGAAVGTPAIENDDDNDSKGSTAPKPKPRPLPPTYFLTSTQVSGNADPTTTVKISYKYEVTNSDATKTEKIAEHIAFVNYKGYFEYKFNTELPEKTAVKLECIDENNEKSDPVIPVVESSSKLLERITAGDLFLPKKTFNPEIFEAQPASTTFTYDVKMVTTNFTIPLIRFNLVKDDDTKVGDVLLFNSIGAGVGISWGELTKTTDANGETIDTDFKNNWGVHLGVLFSAGTSGSENKNVFAPTISVSRLDFQVGIGLELGTLAPTQEKVFFTLAYAIPLSKLIKGKFYIINSTKGYNTKHPLAKDDLNKKGDVGKFM